MFGKTRLVLAGLEKRDTAGPLTKLYVDAARAELDAAEAQVERLERLEKVIETLPPCDQDDITDRMAGQ